MILINHVRNYEHLHSYSDTDEDTINQLVRCRYTREMGTPPDDATYEEDLKTFSELESCGTVDDAKKFLAGQEIRYRAVHNGIRCFTKENLEKKKELGMGIRLFYG